MQNLNSGGNFVPWCSTRTRAWVTRRFLGVYPGATRSPSHPSSVSRFFFLFKKQSLFIVSGISIWLLQTSRLGSRRWTFPSPFPSERSQRSRIPTRWVQYIIYSAQNISYVLFRIFFIFWAEYIIYSKGRFTSIKKWWNHLLKVLKIPMYFTVAWEENRLMVDEGHRLKKNRKR